MQDKIQNIQRGRGAQKNPHNRFFKQEHEVLDEFLQHCYDNNEDPNSKATKFINVYPKSIISKINSPDIPFAWSINPYQGCEHGCIYCYARNSHEYWGYSSGTEFEKNILVKNDAPELLREYFRKLKGKPEMTLLSGNTDCYQPIEKKLRITRQLLEICLEHKAPVGIITKNALVLRDLDLLKKLNELDLLRITLSITTLDEQLKRKMEPRTSSIKMRLKSLEVLSKENILVNVNMAPIIPGLNSSEIFDLVKTAGEKGANTVNYTMVRLNGQIADIFADWVKITYPERSNKVLNGIRAMHNGKLNNSNWSERMRGGGTESLAIKKMFQLARKKYLKTKELPPLNRNSFIRNPKQMTLF